MFIFTFSCGIIIYGDRKMKNAYRLFNISEKLEEIARKSEEEVKDQFKELEENALYNQARVLKAFHQLFLLSLF